jgi:2-oxoglutarate ferredoxin oxidoreductase subunit alpha
MFMQFKEIFTFKIGGEAGQGQQVAGLILFRAFSRSGYFSFDYSEYPSRIRGGLVTYQASASSSPVFAVYDTIDAVAALNKETLEIHLEKLAKGAVIFYDSDKIKLEKKISGAILVPIPCRTLNKEIGAKFGAENMIAAGAVAGLVNLDLKILSEAAKEIFSAKKETMEANLKAICRGYEIGRKISFSRKFPPRRVKAWSNLSLTSNEAVALGAVASGCRFYSAYPMTPASSVLHNLAEWSEGAGMVVKHAEDEISAVLMAIGASYAGVRAMTGTSGGGFALMAEALSLSGMTEIPLVIFESQRPAPATGLPTWTEQGDLRFLANAGHGDFIRAILAPADAEEAFCMTSQAFNLAEKYQIPVFVLLDKYLSEGRQTVPDFDIKKIKIERGEILTEKDLAKIKKYRRYLLTANGVSPRSLPGEAGGIYIANSDEHDEFGYSIEGFNNEMRKKQMEKRLRKLNGVLKELPKPKIFGPEKAKITLVGWGSIKGPVLEALPHLANVNYVHFPAPFPLFPLRGISRGETKSEAKKMLGRAKEVVCVENNATGQFAEILGQHGIKVASKINKYDGRPFFPEEIVDRVKNASLGAS